MAYKTSNGALAGSGMLYIVHVYIWGSTRLYSLAAASDGSSKVKCSTSSVCNKIFQSIIEIVKKSIFLLRNGYFRLETLG